MSIDYKFSNLLGTVYRQGNLLFTPDGYSVLSPVGNRVSCYDLFNSKSFTFAYEHRKNIARIALNPKGNLLLSVDDDGRAILVNFVRRTVLHHFNFKEPVTDIKFSPCGRYFAVACGKRVQLWHTPQDTSVKQFAPFVRLRVYTGHYSPITQIEWSPDSRFFLTASKDLTAKLHTLSSEESGAAVSLAGHKDSVIGAFFSDDQTAIYTISKDGALFVWKYGNPNAKSDSESDAEMSDDETEGRWYIAYKHFFFQDRAKCTAFHSKSSMLVVGFSNGVFGQYEIGNTGDNDEEDIVVNEIQRLSASQQEIDYVTINSTGEWLAMGASKLGQLLVWEWQSESYVLKQQSHYDSLNTSCYSVDGSKLITGADDGKIKVWDTSTGFSIVTFSEHNSAVTGLAFSSKGNVLFSSSLDGSIRAWDLIRYRNFRIFTAPERVQFSTVAIDPSGEVVCAGSLDNFDIYLWSVQSGQLLDTLSGHTGPVSGLVFGANSQLASSSWDRTVRVWNIFGRGTQVEPLELPDEVLDLAFSPDSKQLAVSTLNGEITMWDVSEGKQVGLIDGRYDISGGRFAADRFSSENSKRSKAFTTISYSADGSCILAGGNSRFICLYDVVNNVLLEKYTISRNMAIDGTLDFLNSKDMTEAGPKALLDLSGDYSDEEDRVDNYLPGASRGDASVRKVRPQIKCASVQFSPTNISFSAASTEGLLIYSLDEASVEFDPFDLDVDITVDTTLSALKNHDYLKALVMAFRLGHQSLITRVYECIPLSDIDLIAREISTVYLLRFLEFISRVCENQHFEFHLLWIKAILTAQGPYMIKNKSKFAPVMRSLQKFINKANKDFVKLASSNTYYVSYLTDNEEAGNGGDSEMSVEADGQQNGNEEQDGSDQDDSQEEDEEGWYGPESKGDALISSPPYNQDSDEE